MKATSKIIITFAKQYQMDDGTRGTTTQYFFLDDEGVFQKSDENGQQNAKVSLSYDCYDKLTAIPGAYEGTFEMTTGSDRKPVLKLVDVEYIGGAIMKWDKDSAFSKQHQAVKDAKGDK